MTYEPGDTVPKTGEVRCIQHQSTITPAQEADLIERGLPEIMVRSRMLDYPSLTSGCMADRLRNGYA